MEYRKIKIDNKENEVSLLGFGCMRFPTKDGEVDAVEAKKMIDFAVKNGVNYIDTAYPYHGGKSETVVRDIIKDYDRESFYLADKLPLWDCETKEDIDRIFHEQLTKCGVEYFDFYLIHAVNKDRLKQVKELNVIKQLEQYRNDGKIRNIGFSFHDDLETFKKWVNLYDWDFVQIQLNYMDTDHQQGLKGYDILTEKNIPVIIMEPVKGGSLAKFNDDIETKLKTQRPNKSVASWAFRWVGSLPNVKVILSGMTTIEQVKDNIDTFTNFKPLTQKEQQVIKDVKEDILSRSKVDCTSCGYCMPCPQGVDIPGNFRLYNNHAMYGNDKHTKWAYNNLKDQDKDASVCIDCGECLPKCPQFIEIPTKLEEFTRYLEENGLE